MKYSKWLSKINREQIISLNKKGNSIAKIAEIIEVPKRRLGEIIKDYNIPIIKGRLNAIEDNFFDTINTEIKAYLLGYIIADGSISYIKTASKPNNIKFMFGCQYRDVYFMKLIQKYICPTINIIYRKKLNKVRLNFTSRYMGNVFINKYKILPNKTYDLDFEFPMEIIPNELFRHFLRGFIDGDGTIYYDKLNKRVRRVTFCGTQYKFLKQLSDRLTKEIKCSLYYTKHKNKINLQVYSFGINVTKDKEQVVFNYLYKNSEFYLERKKSKFFNQYRGN